MIDVYGLDCVQVAKEQEKKDWWSHFWKCQQTQGNAEARAYTLLLSKESESHIQQ